MGDDTTFACAFSSSLTSYLVGSSKGEPPTSFAAAADSRLLEIPCNIVLKRFKRPSHWMAIMTVSWALVLMCTGWVNNFGGLATCRLLLGVAEAGFFPGAIMIVSNWYSRRELGVRIALFYTASALAGAFSGLLAYLIAKMDGLAGYAG